MPSFIVLEFGYYYLSIYVQLQMQNKIIFYERSRSFFKLPITI